MGTGTRADMSVPKATRSKSSFAMKEWNWNKLVVVAQEPYADYFLGFPLDMHGAPTMHSAGSTLHE
jgi:hypothetical protein